MFYLLLLALLLRLPLLTQSLWLDESIEALALMGKLGPLLQYALKDFQPPLYHFLLSAWTSLAGYSEIALRTPSLLAGLGVVYFGSKLAALLDKRAGTIAGLLLATNPLLIYYSAEGRTYILTTFLVTASFYYLLSTLNRTNHVRANDYSPLLYLLSTTLALWTSYLAWIIIGLQLLYLLVTRRYKLAQLTALTFATLIFWLPSFLGSLGIGFSTATNSPEWGRVVGGISLKAIALTWVKAVIGRVSIANKYLYAAVVVGLAALHSYVLRRLRLDSDRKLLILMLALTILFASLISLVVPVYSYFRILFLVPLYLILLAVAARSSKLAIYLVIISQLAFTGYYFATPRFHHEDWRALTSYLNSQDGTVALPSLAQNAPLQYYNLQLPLTELKNGEVINSDRLFYIVYVEDLFDVEGLGRANLGELGYNLVGEQTYPGLTLSIYEKN